jgi:hypothetical protein
MKKTRLKRLLVVGLSNIVSGIFFGTGCILIEQADKTWIHPETISQDESSDDDDAPIKHSTAGLTAIKPDNSKYPR